jgi:hypothetical protein
MRSPLRARVLLVAAAAAAAGCASASGAARAPLDPRTQVPPGVRAEWLHFADPAVGPGDPAPRFALHTPDGRTVLSLDSFSGRPLVLIFGSWT